MKENRGWMKYYVKASKLFEAGYGKVMWRFNSVFQVLLVFSTFLVVKGFDVELWHYLVMAVVVVTMIFVSGWFYLHFGFFRADQEAVFSENERICAIQEEVSEIKDLLKGLK